MGCPVVSAARRVQIVGDPVDVVTGASTDISLDLHIPGPIPLYWNRYYDSSQCEIERSLGRGHAHEYDRLLQMDLDGFRYTDPAGKTNSFPPLDHDDDSAAKDGLVLRRVSADVYRLHRSGDPTMVFKFRDRNVPAPLAELRKPGASVSFCTVRPAICRPLRTRQGGSCVSTTHLPAVSSGSPSRTREATRSAFWFPTPMTTRATSFCSPIHTETRSVSSMTQIIG